MELSTDTTILLGAISALGGVVTFLWRQIMTHYSETKQAREECDEDRKKLWAEVIRCNEMHAHSQEILNKVRQ